MQHDDPGTGRSSMAGLVSPAQLRELTEKSDGLAFGAVALNWAVVAGCFAALAHWPTPLVFVLVVIVLGGRQLGFAVLAHEAAHRTLFRTRRFNEGLSDWLCARPVWTDVARYRKHHLGHHTRTGTAGDPDLSLVTPFPTSPGSLARKLLRDIVGISGLRRMVGLVLMDIGVLEYSVAADPQRRPRAGRSNWDYAAAGLRNMSPMLCCNGLIIAVLAWFDAAWVYSAWIVAYLSPFSLFLRIRSIAEHACTQESSNPFLNTRTTRANWLARLTVAPFHVNFHLEHHLLAAVPFYRLPRLHALLREQGAVQAADGYWAVMRLAGAGPARDSLPA